MPSNHLGISLDEGMKKLYVGNFPFDATKEDIMELFANYKVSDVYFPKNINTGESRGFAFVTLDEEEADKAIEDTNGIDFMGRELTVGEPMPRGEKRSRRSREYHK